MASSSEDIRQIVLNITKNKMVKGFYPSFIIKRVKATEEEAMQVLLDLVEEGILRKQFELICPSCFRTIDTQNAIDQFQETYTCLCGEEIEEIDESMCQIVFRTNRHSLLQ